MLKILVGMIFKLIESVTNFSPKNNVMNSIRFIISFFVLFSVLILHSCSYEGCNYPKVELVRTNFFLPFSEKVRNIPELRNREISYFADNLFESLKSSNWFINLDVSIKKDDIDVYQKSYKAKSILYKKNHFGGGSSPLYHGHLKEKLFPCFIFRDFAVIEANIVEQSFIILDYEIKVVSVVETIIDCDY